MLGFGGAEANAEPPPKSLDQALAETLALGDAAGCFTGLSIPDADGSGAIDDDDLAFMRDNNQLGRELAAVCGSSAVNSAAALGGTLGSLQTTKTVSQFRLARRRMDSRLGLRGKRSGLGDPVTLAALEGHPPLPTQEGEISPGPVDDSGFGVFVQAEYEWRDRATTALEAGYEAQIPGGLLGLDYTTSNGLVVGAWAGYGNTDAHYTGVDLLIGSPFAGTDTSGLSQSLDPALLSDICNLGPGGGFEDDGVRIGGFVGKRIGGGFADVTMQYTYRDYDYQRNVCAIEAPEGSAPIVADGTPPSGFSSGGIPLDDIYAGTIAGETTLTEWSVSARAGYDFGNDRFLWGPRLSITYVRAKIDAFTETGRTSVTNTVESNLGLITPRAAGDPTGLELSYDEQERTSLQTEAQLVVAYRFDPKFGAIIPRLSASWIHEFEGDRELVTVRMAQDLRAAPTRFSFTTDSVDKDKGVVAVGVRALLGTQFAADLEVTHLIGDDRFDSTAVTAQAHWRF